MSVRIATVLALSVLFVVTGCGQAENGSSVSGEVNENVEAESLSVEVRPMSEKTGIRSSVTLTFRGALEGTRFTQKATYGLFATNGRYLVWKETYLDTLSIYNLRTGEIAHEMRLPRGRGPGEFRDLGGATVTNNDVVYLSEINQTKFLRIDVTKGSQEDLTFRKSGISPDEVDARGNQLFASTSSAPEFAGVIDSNGVFRQASGLDVEAEFGTNPFFSQNGHLDAIRERAFFLTRYRPQIYVFDLEQNRFVKKIVYADVEVEMPGPEKTEHGMVYLPPQKVPLLSRNVVAVSGHPNRVLVQAEGGDEQHTFDPSALYEIDVPTGTVVAEHNLGIKIESVAVADSSLYVYDDERREVFAYRMR